MVLIRDPGIGKGLLQTPRVRPGVLGSAYTASLADVEQPANPSRVQRGEKAVAVEAVDANRCQLRHGLSAWCPWSLLGCVRLRLIVSRHVTASAESERAGYLPVAPVCVVLVGT